LYHKHALGAFSSWKKVWHLCAEERRLGSGSSGDHTLRGVRKCLLEDLKARDCLLEDLKRLPVLQDLVRKPALMGNGGDGNIGSVISPRKECLIEPVKLRKKERRSLLLLRDSVLRAASTTSPYTRR
jgi:hypothetical protein